VVSVRQTANAAALVIACSRRRETWEVAEGAEAAEAVAVEQPMEGTEAAAVEEMEAAAVETWASPWSPTHRLASSALHLSAAAFSAASFCLMRSWTIVGFWHRDLIEQICPIVLSAAIP